MSSYSAHNGVVGRVGRVGPRKMATTTNGVNGVDKRETCNKDVNIENYTEGLGQSVVATTGPYGGLDQVQVTRLMIQALSTTYPAVADHLRQESGCNVDAPVVDVFRAAILGGEWAQAEAMMKEAVAEDVAVAAAAAADQDPSFSRIMLAPGADANLMTFWIREQKYLETIEREDTMEALNLLRTEIAPMCPDITDLQRLSRLLMTATPDDLRSSAKWDGAGGTSRQVLLDKLSDWVAPSMMLPKGRLFGLLNEAFESQQRACKFHTSNDPPSLYASHQCPRDGFPDTFAQALSNVGGEVWKVRFSHDGRLLAACGMSGDVVVWSVETLKKVFTLEGHQKHIVNITWSPDNDMLVTCSFDYRAGLWDMKSGSLVKMFDELSEPYTACAWIANDSFILSSFDKFKGLQTYSTSTSTLTNWNAGVRVQDVVSTPDGKWTITIDSTESLHVWDTHSRKSVYTHKLASRPRALAASRNCVHIVINCSADDAFLFNLDRREIVQTYSGHKGNKHQVTIGFGGPQEDFVVCGSEDGNLLIWRRHSGELVLKFAAHAPMCNTVHWNPVDGGMYATGGDDGLVKIWTTKARAEGYRHPRRESIESDM